MPNSISYEFLTSIIGQPNGLANLDQNNYVPYNLVQNTLKHGHRGEYNYISDLSNIPNAIWGDYAYVLENQCFYSYNKTSSTWLKANVSLAEYNSYNLETQKLNWFLIESVGE